MKQKIKIKKSDIILSLTLSTLFTFSEGILRNIYIYLK